MTWTLGSSSGSQTLTSADNLLETHINELRQAGLNTIINAGYYGTTWAAINLAIAVLPSTGGAVFVPAGTWIADTDATSISLPSNVWLFGAGDATILQFISTGSGCKCIINSDTTDGNTNIKISNLKIDGNKTGRTAGNSDYGIYFDNIDNLTIRDFTIINSRWTDIWIDNITNGVIDNYYSSGVRAGGLDMQYNNRFVKVSNCYVTGVEHVDGLFSHAFRLNGSDNHYSNCIAVDCGDAAFGIGTGAWASRAIRGTIDHCIAYDTRDYGFFFGYAEDCAITNCLARTKGDSTFKASGSGGGIGFQYVDGLLIYGNICVDNYYSEIMCSDQTAAQISSRVKISNNICMNNDGTGGAAYSGIFIYAAADATSKEWIVEGNICGDTQATPTQAYGIRSSTGTNQNHVIKGNYCFGNYYHGITVAMSGGIALIEGNFCFNNGRGGTGYGIATVSMSNSIISNNLCYDDQVTATQLAGIYTTHIAAANQYNIVNGNYCNGNKQHGIWLINGNYYTVTGNQCVANSQQTDNTYSGIYLSAMTYTTLTGNVCTSPNAVKQKYGIEENGTCTNNNIIGNIVAGNDTGGILLTSTTNYLTRNQGYVTENSGTGSIASGATSATITHGCAYTPTLDDINITFGEQGTSDYGRWWVSTITATQFTLNVSADPGASGLDFAWKAIVL